MKLIIVEDDPILLESLKLLLAGETGLTVSGAYGNAEDALRSLKKVAPEVMLADLGLPGMSGIELIKKAKEEMPHLEIMAHTVFEDRENVFSAIKAGASGYILKGSSPREIVEAIHEINKGGAPMSPKIARKVIHEFQDENAGEQQGLSQRERNIVKCVEQGLTYKEIEKQVTTGETTEEVTYRTLPNEKIGILTVNNFMSIYEPVKQAFSQLQEDGVQDLIVDIRKNGGGHLESLDLFMNYLTDQPYQKCYKCAKNRPWDNVSNRYHGNIYLLIGPDTYSAAVLLATILQDHKLATLVGEETAETSSFCGYVIIGGEPLPKTGLKYSVSGMCYVRPNGIVDGRGVIPDKIVKPTINDKITGSDPVLDYTLKMIRDNQ